MARNRFNSNISGTARVIHLRTGWTKELSDLTPAQVVRWQRLLQARLSTLKATRGTIADVWTAVDGRAWITLEAGSLPARTCMDMSAFAAGALAMMVFQEG